MTILRATPGASFQDWLRRLQQDDGGEVILDKVDGTNQVLLDNLQAIYDIAVAAAGAGIFEVGAGAYSAQRKGLTNQAAGLRSLAFGFNNIVDSGSPDSIAIGGDLNGINNGDVCAIVGGSDTDIIIGSMSMILNAGFSTIQNTAYGTLLAGWNNEINNCLAGATIISGISNELVGGLYDVIIGGQSNYLTNAFFSAIIGGEDNSMNIGTTNGHSVILGGENNTLNHRMSTILGGEDNVMDDGKFNPGSRNSSIVGGKGNRMYNHGGSATIGGYNNTMWGTPMTGNGGYGNAIIGSKGCELSVSEFTNFTTVVSSTNVSLDCDGGYNLVAGSGWSDLYVDAWETAMLGTWGSYINDVVSCGMVCGESHTMSDGRESVIIGGDNHTADSVQSCAIVAGDDNTLDSCDQSVIIGGTLNEITGVSHSIAAGFRAKVNHDNTFAWADGTAADFASSAADQFLVRASGGVGIGTNDPKAQLHSVGSFILGTPPVNTAEPDVDMHNESIHAWIDKAGSNLVIKVKDDAGAVKTVTLPMV